MTATSQAISFISTWQPSHGSSLISLSPTPMSVSISYFPLWYITDLLRILLTASFFLSLHDSHLSCHLTLLTASSLLSFLGESPVLPRLSLTQSAKLQPLLLNKYKGKHIKRKGLGLLSFYFSWRQIDDDVECRILH